MRKIAIFGSAFNPPTLGHKSVIESLTHFDNVLLVPSYAHAWGKKMLDFDLRCQMVNHFISDLAQSNVRLSRMEEELYCPGESVTTYALLEELERTIPSAELTFIVGPDNFYKFNQFYLSEAITRRWSIMVCPEKISVRSTLVRSKLAQGEAVTALTTDSVNNFLRNHHLYRMME